MMKWSGACLLAFAATVAHAQNVERELHVVVAATGDVQVMRKGWSSYTPAAFGASVNRGDLMRLGAGARATVACADLTVHEVPAGKVSGVPCAGPAQPLLVYEGSLLNPTRAAANPSIPMVIAPRRTKLIDAHPLLRWKPVPGTTRYKVRVSGGGLDWSTDVSGADSVAYPADAPALKPSVTYKVSVTAGSRNSDELGEGGSGFTLLDAAGADEVRALVERIRALELSPEATQYLAAQVYAARGLHAEAIGTLEALANATPGFAVSLAIARQYQQVGLSELAERNLLQAFKEAGDHADVEGQALSQRALGFLYRDAFGLPADATQAFRSALASYEKLGAVKDAAEVQGALTEVDPR